MFVKTCFIPCPAVYSSKIGRSVGTIASMLVSYLFFYFFFIDINMILDFSFFCFMAISEPFDRLLLLSLLALPHFMLKTILTYCLILTGCQGEQPECDH